MLLVSYGTLEFHKKWRILFGVAEQLLSSHEFCFSSRKAQVKTNHNNYMQPGWSVKGGPVVIVSFTTSYGRVLPSVNTKM
jgi:hypothetical protein